MTRKNLPDQLRQFALTGIQSDEKALIEVLCLAADEISICWNYVDSLMLADHALWDIQQCEEFMRERRGLRRMKPAKFLPEIEDWEFDQ